MIIFEFDTDSVEGCTRPIYWLGNTSVVGEDKNDAAEIYEQIMAHECYLDD